MTWDGLRWPGATVAILASGPSLSLEQCSRVNAWRNYSNGRCIAVNTTFRRAPFADVLYAADGVWWDHYIEEVRESFFGDLWTSDKVARRSHGLRHIRSRAWSGLSDEPGVVNDGGNSGYQAIGLAVQAGATRIILLGFDMQGRHWHPEHPLPLTNIPQFRFAQFIENFDRLAVGLAKAGVSVVNCSAVSALTCFPKSTLKAELANSVLA